MDAQSRVRPDAVAIYIRWSTDEQTEGTTLEVQKERTDFFARSQGWTVNPDLIFVDEGHSGGSLDRPALTCLRQAVQAGLVDCVVTYRLDRLSRNLVDTVDLIRKEWAGRCVYRSATEGFDTSDSSPTGALIFNILASFAEFERAVIRERTMSGRVRRVKEGAYHSAVVPYGYVRGERKGTLEIKGKAEDGNLVAEAAIVADMFEIAGSGAATSAAAIARVLNGRGIPSPRGTQWTNSTVQRILENPVYAGHIDFNRKLRNKVGTACPRVTVLNVIPAIVSQEVFEKAQQTLAALVKARPKGANRAREEYLLTSIAKCRCGIRVEAVRDSYGKLWYRCPRPSKGMRCSAGGMTFPALPAHEMIGRLVKGRFGASAQKEDAVEWGRMELAGEQRQAQLEQVVQELEQRREQVQATARRLLRQARDGEIALRTYEEFRADTERELAEVAAKIAALREELAAAAAAHSQIDFYRAAVQTADTWSNLTAGAKKHLLRMVVRRLVVIKTGRTEPIDVEIEWAM